jgi:hypothetical protein
MTTYPIAYPPVLINQYLADVVTSRIPDRFSGAFRFFPTSPTDINALTEGFPEASSDVFAVYDRMFRFRRTPFPHIKSEQLLYYFYKVSSDPEGLIETSQVVYDLLDREDESAEDVNKWIRTKLDANGNVTFGSGNLARTFKPVYFHNIKVYQLQETRDIISFGTARTYAGNKLIIDYEYHVPDDPNSDNAYNHITHEES